MAKTKPSKYILDQEHITDRELDGIFALAQELQLQITRFREYDTKYRAMEGVSTMESEKERTEILNASIVMLDKIGQMTKEIQEVAGRVTKLFYKAKGALEAKLEMER